MPSSYSSSLRFELQATGENSATWGSIVNTQFQLIEAAIAGWQSIALADANRTLTVANGISDESRSAMLRFTGTLTAARVITIPSASKLYVIHNNTTGGFGLDIKTSGGAAVRVPAGTRALIMCDGTDCAFVVGDPSTFALTSGNNTFTGTNQFTTIDVGNADTTLSRLSAGVLAVEGATVYTSGNLPGTSLTWTAIQGFSTTAQMTLGAEFRLFESTNSNNHGVRNNANTLSFRYNGGTDYLTVSSAGLFAFGSRPTFAGNTPYDSGNLPGTALTWTAQQTFNVNNPTIFNRPTDAGSQIQINNGGSSAAFIGAFGGFCLRVFNSGASEVLRTNNSTGVTDFLFNPTVNGNTLFHAGNLPGTALTWTGVQRLPGNSSVYGTAGTFRLFNFQTGTSDRFRMGLESTAESGSNAGSNFGLYAIADDGTTTLSTVFAVTRSTGIVNFTATPFVGANTVYTAGNLPGTAITWTAAQTFNSGAVVVTSANGSSESFRSARADSIWAFYNAAQSARLGFTRHDSATMYVVNEVSGGAISFTTTGGGSFAVNGNAIYHAGNLPGTAITWTAIQSFSTTAQMTAGAEFRIFESTNNNYHGVRNATNTLAFRYNGGADYLTIANTGVATFASRPVFAGNTPYDSGNLPGTSITWTASANFTGGLQRSGVDVVDLSASQTLTNKTLTSPTISGTPTITGGTIGSRTRALTTTTGTLVVADANCAGTLTGGITLPNSVFTAGDMIFMNAGGANRTITRGAGIAMHLNGVDVATATLNANTGGGVFWESASKAILTGGFV